MHLVRKRVFRIGGEWIGPYPRRFLDEDRVGERDQQRKEGGSGDPVDAMENKRLDEVVARDDGVHRQREEDRLATPPHQRHRVHQRRADKDDGPGAQQMRVVLHAKRVHKHVVRAAERARVHGQPEQRTKRAHGNKDRVTSGGGGVGGGFARADGDGPLRSRLSIGRKR